MKTERKKQIIFLVITIILLVMFLIHVVPIPFYHVYSVIEVKLDDPSYSVAREIEISGYYHINVFDDNFSGKLTVSGYPATMGQMSDFLVRTEDGAENGIWYRVYDGNVDNIGHLNWENYSLGHIVSTFWFQKAAIKVYGQARGNGERGWSDKKGYCIVLNANSRNEAICILDDLGITAQ
jgi:hypothetical protein